MTPVVLIDEGGSEVRGMRLEVRRSRSLRSSDLLPLTSGSSQGRVHDLGRRTKDDSSQRTAELLVYSGSSGRDPDQFHIGMTKEENTYDVSVNRDQGVLDS
ncbi:hypothetical protein RJ60_07005 [Mesotoga sp. B105.6.4]|nr:hypothetical protein RJ60_07005 [Mesotoga sp. B105.6.4]